MATKLTQGPAVTTAPDLTQEKEEETFRPLEVEIEAKPPPLSLTEQLEPQQREDLPFPTLPATTPYSRNLLENLGVELKAKERDIRTIVGDRYDPSDTVSDAFLTVADMTRNTSLVDKQKKWRADFPNGSLIAVPTATGTVLLGRKDVGEDFQELPGGPEITGSVVSFTGAGSLIGSVIHPAATFAGTFVGNLLDNQIEEWRGFSNEPSLIGASIEGGIAAGADAATRGFARLLFGPRHPPAIAEAMVDAVVASKELGLSPLATGQLGGPLKRGLFRQVAVTSPKVERLLNEQQTLLRESMDRQVSKVPDSTTTDDMLAVIRKEQDELDTLISRDGIRRPDASEALSSGVSNYKNSSKHVRDRLYSEAIAKSDDITFSLKPALDEAEGIRLGVRARVDPEDADVLRNIALDPKSDLAILLKDISDMGAVEGGVIRKVEAGDAAFTAFEQVKALRTRAWDLKQADDGTAKGRAVRRAAGDIYTSLTKVMDHPISGDPAFVSAYKTATYFNRMREHNLELVDVAKLLQAETPERIASKFFNPGFSKELTAIRDLVPVKNWNDFRAGFQMDILHMERGQSGLTRMNNFKARDPDGWEMLVTAREEKEMSNILIRKSQINKSPIRNNIRKELSEGEKLVELANAGTTGQLEKMIARGGGIDSNIAMRARAGFYKKLLDDSTVTNIHGIRVIEPDKLLKAITTAENSGRLQAFMRPSDFRTLELYRKYTAPLSESADIGGGMMGGALRQQAVQAPFEIITGGISKIAKRLVRPLLSNDVTAFILSRPAGANRLMMGQSRLPDIMAGMAVGLEVILRGEQRATPSKEDLTTSPIQEPEETFRPLEEERR